MTSKLRSLIAEETHWFVRHHAFLAIEIQTQRNFALAAHLLQALLERVGLADRPAVVELGVRTYLYQRQQLGGGDRRVEIDGRNYPVWTGSTRPLTGLEASLYGWILDEDRPIAQQLAVAIFAALSDTALDREERRLRAAAAKYADLAAVRPAAAGGGGDGQRAPEARSLAILGHLAVLLAAPRKPELRPILCPLLAELIYQRRVPAAAFAPQAAGQPALSSEAAAPLAGGGELRIEELLARWTGVRNATTGAIAAYLRRALAFYRWRWVLVMAAACLMATFYQLGKHGWEAWRRHRAAPAAISSNYPRHEAAVEIPWIMTRLGSSST